MTFQEAVQQSPALNDKLQPGLQALGSGSARIRPSNPRKITGSVNIETAMRAQDPQAPTWDFAIGYQTDPNDHVYFIEIHSADSNHAQPILNKFNSLVSFLAAHAPTLRQLPKQFIWLATGPVTLKPQSLRRCREAGILVRSSPLTIPESSQP